MFIKFDVEEQKFESLIQSYVSEYSKEYPMKFGEEFTIKEKNQTALFLVNLYYCTFNLIIL